MLVTLVIIGLSYSFISLEEDLARKLEQKKFLQPTEYYASAPSFSPRMVVSINQIEALLQAQSYRARSLNQRLLPGDYFIGTQGDCQALHGVELASETLTCIGFVNKNIVPQQAESETQWISFGPEGILQTFKEHPQQPLPEAILEAPLFAQYVDQDPLMQEQVELGQIPPKCLNAVMAIEDQKFLEHSGFSTTGLFRALLKNLIRGKSAQGGSTITQQLVKNYFLTSEKTIKRKAQELVMSILLESKLSKDQILELYLNVIYLGQNGPFRVHGYGAAAKYYFSKSISDLNLGECSLLAAIVNNPGGLNPWRKPQNALKRRELVLNKMKELNLISDAELAEAKNEPLPKTAPQALAVETAPYFIDAVRKQMKDLQIPIAGTKIYTSLDLVAQQTAQLALQEQLKNLEENNKYLKTLKAKGLNLEGALLSGDPKTGLVKTVVGGRSFRMTQFNRAIDGHRQVGSIMKPFVFLTALNTKAKDGKDFTPMTLVNDEKFDVKYDGQQWSPDNYDNKYYGTVPLFYALKNSLNAATASTGLEVGLDNIVTTVKSFGVSSNIKAVPAMTLGAFEMYPKEVLLSYMGLANMGYLPELSFIRKVTDQHHREIFSHASTTKEVFNPAAVASVVGAMKQTVLSGTARSLVLNGFTHPSAGKTGTTSDNKDAWFAGFTPHLATVVWLGYDNNTPTKLTGSSGAVPIWLHYMKKSATIYPPDDFSWPESTRKVILNESELKSLNAIRDGHDPNQVELIFKKELAPWF